jgi:PAS domain S-box-containing protein
MRATRAMLDEASAAILFNRDLLRATLENVSQGIGMFDPGQRLSAWNRRFLELLGIPEELAQFGTSLALIVESPQRRASPMSVNLAMLLEAQTDPARAAAPHTYERRHDDGRVLELQTNPMPAGGFVLVCTDITERRRAEEALRNAQMELTRVARLTTMGELVASIAHEINQPLAAIAADGTACLHWLDRDKPDLDGARSAASRIVQDAGRAGDVIRGLRALATTSGSQLTEVDIHDVIRDVLALTRAELQRHGVVLRTDLRADDRRICGDRVQLQQVLLNLIMNGVEAMSAVADRPKILAITAQSLAPTGVRVTVEDTGTGLDPATAGRIFDPFFTTKPTGMGMGLSICRSIIDAHGGRLRAEPNRPHGATFELTLPSDRGGHRLGLA